MNSESCPDCGASLKPGTPYCSACLLSAGQATEPTNPVSAGLIVLPCDFGPYRLLRKLGAGGMGVVYEAEERTTGRRLALKVLRQSIDTEEQRKRFRREGRLAASINHPNSLYIFGTDEIEGVPVIATELADGGTLHDEVKRRGPLPIKDAVDAILSVLDGLEAAHRQGVLHRDMKPSNCFVSTDGVTKVGDYGLSISYSDDKPGDDPLTRSGVIMGTPAFSPPEQLRGEVLDPRTDIYSTAATLYYLLTGRLPVEAETSIGTVAAVLEGRIRPPQEHRPELPVNLSAAILRGLATDKAHRPPTHAAFRLSLAPFGSEAPQPAPLGLRLLAGVLDAVIVAALLSLFWMIPTMAAMTSESQIFWVNVGTLIATILGYTLIETRTGATPGKRLFRIQVLGQGGSLPAWRPCLLRSSLFVACSALFDLTPASWVEAAAQMMPTGPSRIVLLLGLLILPSVKFVLFLPSLRRKDRAAWHDLVSGLRVTCRRHGIAHAAFRSVVPKSPATEGGTSWGGLILGIEISKGRCWAHDPLLQRPLLLRRRMEADLPPTEARRFCSRPGRLRWHQSVSDPEGACWDVWQAIPGQPLADLLAQPTAPTWELALPWLRDLATEMDAAQKDGTLPPELTSNHIWISQIGHAVLLDKAWQGSPEPLFQSQDPQEFLACVAGLAEASTRPIHADRVMESLQRGSFERLSHAAGTFAHLQQLPSMVNPAKRAACLLAPMVAAILIGLVILQMILTSPHEWNATFPGRPPLPEVMQLHLRQTKAHGAEHPLKEAIRQHVVGHYGTWVRDHGVDSLPANPWNFFGDELETFVTDTISGENAISEAALESADEEIRRALEQNPSKWHLQDLLTTKASQVAAVLFTGCAICIGLCQFICILALGSPLLMHLSGVTVISQKKRPASRGRIVWRWCLGWGLMLLFAVPATVFAVVMPEKDPSLHTSEHAVILLLPLVLIFLLSSLLPMLGRRSLVDRLAGTWLVAR